MTTTVTLRKVLDLKRWEMCAPYAVTSGLAGNQIAVSPASTLFDQYIMLVGVTFASYYLYDPREDSYLLIPTPTGPTASSFNLAYHTSGPTGTASAGSATTLTTVTTLPGSVVGYTVRITGGTGAGQERTITANTTGANSVLTVSAWGTNPDNTSTYLLLTGRFWMFSGAATATLQYYDVATGAWTSGLSVSGVTASGVHWAVTATPAFGNATATGTATAGAATTLTNSGKAWATNQWANYQVRITSGTGAGQVRTISSNTGTVLTVSSSWGTNPDATSVYSIEPNDDYLYVTGAAVALYRYSISANTWSTLSPGVARTTAPGVGSNLSWIANASDATWADETSIKNGRYIYSWGGSSSNLAVYDIAANTWTNTQTSYLRSNSVVPASGYGWAVDREFIYISNATGNPNPQSLFRYNAVTNTVDAFATFPIISSLGSTMDANRLAIVTYTDGGTTIRWAYLASLIAGGLSRIMII